MATRSTIALEYADGTVEQIYCHWDGYLENNGKILAEHYTDPFKVQMLMAVGAISSLQENVLPEEGQVHSYECPAEGVVIAYGRDRGETDTEANCFKDFDDYLRNHQYEEYEYILRQGDGKAVWFVSSYGSGYVTLAEAFAQEAAERESEEMDL